MLKLNVEEIEQTVTADELYTRKGSPVRRVVRKALGKWFGFIHSSEK